MFPPGAQVGFKLPEAARPVPRAAEVEVALPVALVLVPEMVAVADVALVVVDF